MFISDFDSALRVDRGREKLERSKLHGQPIKYSVHGTPGYRPPEVGEGRVSYMGWGLCRNTMSCLPYSGIIA